MFSPVEKIEVIGSGAMGGFYASKFFNMDENAVALIAKGARYKRLKEKGLTVNNRHYAFRIVSPEEQAASPDLIVVALKYHHLQESMQDIRNRVGAKTQILSVMNGIDSEEMIGAAFGMDKVLYGSAMGTLATRDGDRVTVMQEGKLLFGEEKNESVSDRVRQVQSTFEKAQIAYEIPKDMIRILWLKFMMNVGINQVSAALRAANGILQVNQEAMELMVSAMREVLAISRAAGIDLSEKDIENFHSFLSGLNPEGKTSMLQDVEAGRKTEVEMFAGKVIGLGKKYDIPTPVNQTLFRLIRATEQSYL